jgi:hypothetical protein
MESDVERIRLQRFKLMERIVHAAISCENSLEIVDTTSIAEEMEISSNHLLRLLSDLEGLGYIEFASDGGFYSRPLILGKNWIEDENRKMEENRMRFETNALVTLVKKETGQRIEQIKAHVQPDFILIPDGSVPVEEEDVVERVLRNGLTERFIIVDRGYFEANRTTAAHYQMTVRKESSTKPVSQTHINYNISGANSRVTNGNDNSTNIIDNSTSQFSVFRDMIKKEVTLDVDRDEILKKLDELERSSNKRGGLEVLGKLASMAVKYAPLIAGLLPRLHQWVQALPP